MLVVTSSMRFTSLPSSFLRFRRRASHQPCHPFFFTYLSWYLATVHISIHAPTPSRICRVFAACSRTATERHTKRQQNSGCVCAVGHKTTASEQQRLQGKQQCVRAHRSATTLNRNTDRHLNNRAARRVQRTQRVQVCADTLSPFVDKASCLTATSRALPPTATGTSASFFMSACRGGPDAPLPLATAPAETAASLSWPFAREWQGDSLEAPVSIAPGGAAACIPQNRRRGF